MVGRLGRVLVGGTDRGAGFALGSRLVITANHVVGGRGDKPVTYVPTGGQSIGVERVQSDVGHDAAILWLASDVGEFLPASATAQGTRWVVGSPPPASNDPQLHGRITTALMTIQSAHGQPLEVVQLEVDEHLGDFGGYSGSAVLDSLGRAVLALLVEQKPLRKPVVLGERQAASNVLYAVPIGDVITANCLPVQVSRPLNFGRLPPDPADRELVCLYLAALIRRLSADPWPLDPRLGGPALSPSSIEQRLTLREADGAAARGSGTDERYADDLADRCARLVVLGGPGAGKTWFAMRTARRSAEAALHALTTGDVDLTEVELPLFTTCSLLSTTTGGVRDAAVSSALDQLGDLGGSRIAAAIRAIFTERNVATLLIIDSLDEASDPDDRLRQADTLPWRIILTSRASAWRHQLVIEATDDSHQVAWLQQLHYPKEVEQIIARWFAADPAHGHALTEQIAARKDLQRAATVPLILAFFCILGGNARLPDTLHEVYAHVTWRLLSGLWRGTDGYDADPPTRVSRLRDWAWEGAAKDDETGIGVWADEILTPYMQLGQPDKLAMDHAAPPLGLPDLATGATRRRFIHRSLREYLTADYVATEMSADQAAAELLNHIWYDPDWEYAGPAALAMHPKRDQVLKKLLSQITQSVRIPDDLAPVDGCWELRRFLTRVAWESREADWTTESAAIIGRSWLDIAAQEGFRETDWKAGLAEIVGPPGLDIAAQEWFRLPTATSWPTTARQILREVLAQLAAASPSETQWFTEVLSGLDPEPSDFSQARSRVLDVLDAADSADTPLLVEVLVGLGPKIADLARGRRRVLDQLDSAALWNTARLAETLTRLKPEHSDLAWTRERVLDQLDSAAFWNAARLTDVLMTLSPGPGDHARARDRVLLLLGTATDPRETQVLAKTLNALTPMAADLVRGRGRVLDLLDTVAGYENVERLVEVVHGLDPDAADLVRARNRVLHLMDAADSWGIRALVKILTNLDPEPADLAWARGRVLDLLHGTAEPDEAERLVDVLRELDPGPGDLARARGRVLDQLDSAAGWTVAELIKILTALDPESADLSRACDRILDMLRTAVGYNNVQCLIEVLPRLAPSRADLARVRRRVLRLLDSAAGSFEIQRLVGVLTDLGPTQSELARARGRVLDLLGATAKPHEAESLARALARLMPEPGDLARARGRALGLLDAATDGWNIQELLEMLDELSPQADDLARARRRLLELLESAAQSWNTRRLVEALFGLGLESGHFAEVGRRVLDQLDVEAEPVEAGLLLELLGGLDLEPADWARARTRVLDLLDSAAEPGGIHRLVQALSELTPERADLARARTRVLDLLDGHGAEQAPELVQALSQLCPEPNDLARVHGRLLDLMDTTGLEDTVRLAEVLRGLHPEPAHLSRARGHIAGLIGAVGPRDATRLAEVLRELKPVAIDLAAWDSWAVPPGHDLLGAVRQHSSLRSWLEILPTLAGIAATPNLVHAIPRKPNLPRVEIQQAEGMIAAALGIQPGATVVSRRQEYFIDETPWRLQTIFYPMTLVEQGAAELLEVRGIRHDESSYLSDIIASTAHRDMVLGRISSESERAFFQLDGDASVIEMRRIAVDAARKPVRLTIAIYLSDRDAFTA